jgi:hypothetical protein
LKWFEGSKNFFLIAELENDDDMTKLSSHRVSLINLYNLALLWELYDINCDKPLKLNLISLLHHEPCIDISLEIDANSLEYQAHVGNLMLIIHLVNYL